jgi:Transcription elongation factor
MSRAFVKEPDGDDVAAALPDRQISTHRNFVTSTGLARIDATLERLRSDVATAQAAGDKAAVSVASRERRYWTARRGSAELVEIEAGDEVRFGSIVTFERSDGRRQTFRITGEDEAEPAEGTLSYVSPLARALIGKRPDDEFEFQGEPVIVIEVA